ncbi:PCI/PINT associated module [Lasiodiplodia theobromae]|uniref:PCI/PINT associated module n=1 Tax=Lasiodiplodia theobromae TaxID=45133 RepID=A0A8H7MC85_9PEZI|nr:PCI/PINT associated module [Lasiodiplodia theobromae]
MDRGPSGRSAIDELERARVRLAANPPSSLPHASTTESRFEAFLHDADGDPVEGFLAVLAQNPHITLGRDALRAVFVNVWQSVAPEHPYDWTLPARLRNDFFKSVLYLETGREVDAACISMAITPTVDQFLVEIAAILQAKDGAKLQDYLVFEPTGGVYPPLYTQMINEIRGAFPKGTEDALEEKCNRALPGLQELDDGSSWSAFVRFIAQYFAFLRDLDVENLSTKQLEAYNLLAELAAKCNSALAHSSMGIVILPTVINCSRMLAALAIILDKRPDLIVNVQPQGGDDGGEKQTLGEKAVEIIRNAFVTCLNDRTGNMSGVRDGRPDGKRVGIYKLANLCLKILFQGSKSRSADTIFTNIDNASPPLAIFPWPERVTYLYYLGRFHFSNNHFYRAQLALQSAYNQCNPERLNQRRLILIYLVASNIILGRFPSQHLYQQPEAVGLRERFGPICRAIVKGDLARFRTLLDVDKGEHVEWFLFHRILFQLRNRCEVLVWRSLIRRTFLINGDQGDPTSRKAPTLGLQDLVVLAQFLEKKALSPEAATYRGPAQRHPNWAFFTIEPSKNQLYVDADFEGADEVEPEFLAPDMDEIESIVASLIDQGLLGGFISHRQLRFAITGAKRKGALAAGFPKPWQVIKAKFSDEVPGWKADSPTARTGGAFGAGRVINLSGARPVGAAGA